MSHMQPKCFGVVLQSCIVRDLECIIASLTGDNINASMGQRIAPAVVRVLRASVALLYGSEGCSPLSQNQRLVTYAQLNGAKCLTRKQRAWPISRKADMSDRAARLAVR